VYGSLAEAKRLCNIAQAVTFADTDITAFLTEAAEDLINGPLGEFEETLPLSPVPGEINVIANLFAAGLYMQRNGKDEVLHPYFELAAQKFTAYMARVYDAADSLADAKLIAETAKLTAEASKVSAEVLNVPKAGFLVDAEAAKLEAETVKLQVSDTAKTEAEAAKLAAEAAKVEAETALILAKKAKLDRENEAAEALGDDYASPFYMGTDTS